MKARITRALLVLAMAASAVMATGSAAQARHECAYLTITPSNASYYEDYAPTLNYWHLAMWRHISRPTHCDRAVVFTSQGWGFEYYACGRMWVRVMRSDGSTFVLDGSNKAVCGGQHVVLASGQPAGRAFRIEGRRDGSREQGATSPFVGRLRH